MSEKVFGMARSIGPFDLSYQFENVDFTEIAAGWHREYMYSRDTSDDPDIRELSHFEGKLTPYGVNRICSREISEDVHLEMLKMGYRILEFGEFVWDDVAEALIIYKAVNGNVDVPFSFIIEEGVPGFALYDENGLNGLPLGEVVSGIRIGDIDGFEDPERRLFLDTLDFKWGEMSKYLRFRFAPLYYGLRAYRHLYEFPLPPHNFIVPDEPQWPVWMANMPLGEWTTIARIQQSIIEEYYPARKEMLDSLDFIWWIPPPDNFTERYYSPLSLRSE